MKPPMRPKSANAGGIKLYCAMFFKDDTEWIDQRDPDALLTSSKEDAVRPGLASTVVKPSHYGKRPFSAASTPSSYHKRVNVLDASNQSAELSSNFASARAASGVKRPHSAAASTRYQPFRAREKIVQYRHEVCNDIFYGIVRYIIHEFAAGDRLLASTRDHSDNTFVYAVPRHFLGHGLPYDPYDIVPVTHARSSIWSGSISQMKDALWDYYTISKSGYTFHLKSDGFRSTFLSLSNWEAQKEIFTKLRSLSTFSR
ncbi:hypothetical protein GQ600_14550 [Phytophthora cactorum]|nr:hypothetical protein GQ600_14550 [Phytophthora cactorum]